MIQRIRLDCESETRAIHNLNRLLGKPDVVYSHENIFSESAVSQNLLLLQTLSSSTKVTLAFTFTF